MKNRVNEKLKIARLRRLAAGVALLILNWGFSVCEAAESRSFSFASQVFLMEDVSAEVQVFLRAMRFNEATEQWNVDVVLTNSGSRAFARPVFLSIEGFANTTGPISPDGTAGNPPKPFFAMAEGYTGSSLPAEGSTQPRTIVLGFVEGAGVPSLQMKVFAAPASGDTAPALALTRTLNDVGQPLPNVTVFERSPAGDRTLATDPDYGVVTLGGAPGDHVWKFEREGNLPVWRSQSLLRGAVQLIPNPRLAQRATPESVPANSAFQISNSPLVRLEISAGTFSDTANVSLTPVDGQTLPGLLPQGWTPLSAFWFEASVAPTQPVTARLTLSSTLSPTLSLTLVRWDEAHVRWSVVETGLTSNVQVPTTGAYALVVSDPAPLAPPAPVVGQPLPASSLPPQPTPVFAASGSVTPSVSTANRIAEEVTGSASVTISNLSGLLPSGLTLRAEVAESYRLQDGSGRFTAPYETFITGYRSVISDSTFQISNLLEASFPMRPALLFGPEELAEATVRANVISPEVFRGAVFETTGGVIADQGLRVIAEAGDVASPQAVSLRRFNSTNVASLLVPGQSLAAVFDLMIAGVVSNQALSLQISNLAPNRTFVLARILSDVGLNGLEPVERLRSETNGVLTSLEPGTGERLPGLRRAGQYLLVQVPVPHGLISGVVRNSIGDPIARAPVRITGQPWLTLSATDGAYRLVAPTGTVQVVTTDLSSGDTDFTDVVVSDSQPSALDPQLSQHGPRVASVTPAPGSRNVSRVTPIIVTFTEPINPGTIVGANLQLLDSNNVPVATSTVTLNLRNTTATLLPLNPLQSGAAYTIVLSGNISDLTGLPLEGPNQFTFQTQTAIARGDLAKLTIFEPGATNIPSQIASQLVGYDPRQDRNAIVVHGSAGSAEPDGPVIVMNESSGETATVLAKEDGSFVTFIHGAEDDFVSALIQNQNGTQSYLPVSRQEFDNGFVGLFKGGGILEASNEDQRVAIIVQPGAVPSKSKFKVEPIPVADFLALVEGQQPLGGAIVGGLRYNEAGDELNNAVEVAMDVDVASLNLPPGVEPTNGGFGLVIPRKYGGVVVYDLIDTMEFEATDPGKGRLVTHSPPFPGLLARKLAKLTQVARLTDALGSVNVSETDPARGTTTVQLGAITFDLSLSQGVKIAGTVKSKLVNSSGNGVGELKPVAGALIVNDDVNSGRSPGFLHPGEIVGTSDVNGSFASFIRPRSLAVGRELLASHPRFPFQTAQAPLPIEIPNTGVARVELIFIDGTIADLADAENGPAKPLVKISHEPALPALGVGDNDGTLLEMLGIDDVEVKTLDLQVVRVTDPNGKDLDPGVIQQITLPVTGEATLSRKISRVRLKANVKAKVLLSVLVKDNLGLETTASYSVHFGFSARFDSVDPNDHVPPFISVAWPPKFSENIPPLSPIFVRFSEPLNPNQLTPDQWGTWLSFEEPHSLNFIQVSSDNREITVFYDGPSEGDVLMTIQSPLADRNGNNFDQDPAEDGTQAFELEFTQAEQPEEDLDAPDRAAGIVLHGGYLYGATRGSLFSSGELIRYDLADPDDVSVKDTRDLPGWPTALTIIPSYPLPNYQVSGNSVTANGCLPEQSYIAVFTGVANDHKRLTIVPTEGSLDGGGAFDGILSIRISDGENQPSQIVGARWDPPLLGYLEISDVTSISLIDLPAFYLGTQLAGHPDAIESLPRPGDPGVDANGDGDYCDDGDTAPKPFLDPLHPFGFSFSFAPPDPHERIQDFDINSGILAAISTFNDNSQPGRFRVILAATDPDSLDTAIAEFADGLRPQRMILLPATRVVTEDESRLLDLALVSLSTPAPDDRLAVIDLTDPSEPKLLNEISLPPGEGNAYSLIRREDKLIALATGRSTLLIDPSKLLLEGVTFPGPHPAFVGRVDLAAAGTRDFVSDVSGINAVFGNQRKMVRTAPRFQVVTFQETPFSTEDLPQRSEAQKHALLQSAQSVTIVDLAKTDEEGQIIDDLAPELHYYVLVDAPGGEPDGGELLPVLVAGINARGSLYDKKAMNVVPVVIGDNSIQQAIMIKQMVRTATVLSRALDKAVELVKKAENFIDLALAAVNEPELRRPLPEFNSLGEIMKSYLRSDDFFARRLSDNQASPLYNKFLAGPFVVLPNSPDLSLLESLLTQPSKRRFLQATPRLWVGLPTSEKFSGDKGKPVKHYASQFHLNPDLSLEGIIGIDAINGAANQIIDNILGDSDVLAPAILSAITVLTPVKADYNPTILPGASMLRDVAYADRPLIFIPALGGSRLNQQNGEMWPGIFTLSKSNLVMTPAGQSEVPTSPPDALRNVVEIDAGSDTFGFAGIYHGFLELLATGLGYMEYDYFNPSQPNDPFKSYQEQRRRFSGAPNLNQGTNGVKPELFVFAYDWRRDHKIAADLLDEYVKIARAYHPDADGVDIIAHGNGNYIARQYMLDHEGAVRDYFAIAAPWLGSGQPLAAMLTGDIENLALNFLVPIKELRHISQFMPGLHQTLPNKGAFQLGFRPVVERGFDLNKDGTNFQSYTYEEYAGALGTNLFKKTHADAGFTGPVSPVRDNHENFQQPNNGLPIANAASGDPEDLRTYQFLGAQTAPQTISGIRLIGRLHRNPTNIENTTLDLPALTFLDSEDGFDPSLNFGDADGPLGITTNQFRFRANLEVARTLGDGMVPMASAARGFKGGTDFNPEKSQLFPLVSHDPAADGDFSHFEMLKDPFLRAWVGRILSGRRMSRLDLDVTGLGGAKEGDLITVNVAHVSPDGNPGLVTKLIDFGDGGTASHTGAGTPPQLEHRFLQNGTFTVSIGATSDKGFSGFLSRQVVVANVAPKVTIEGGNITVAPNEMRIIVACVEDPGVEDTHTFTWTLDGQDLVGRHSFALPLSFSAAGSYNLSVIAKDSDGDESAPANIIITVDPAAVPVDPLTQTTACTPPSGGSPSSGPAEAIVRITGLAPGIFGSKGVKVVDGSDTVFDVDTFGIPLAAAAVGAALPSLSFPTVLAGQVKRFADALTDVYIQRGFEETAVVYLSPRGGGAPKTTVEFRSRGGPLEVELSYTKGGVPEKYVSWTTNVLNSLLGTPSELELEWGSLVMKLSVAGTEVPRFHEATGLPAADRAPPGVAAIFNPASGNITIIGRDNFTLPNRLQFFLVQDSTGNGDLADEIFYELGTNTLARARLPSRLFTIVARDEVGNVSPLEPLELQSTLDFGFVNGDYCNDLDEIRNRALSAIQDGLNDPAVASIFLLNPAHLWVFEQGSGACLWKANSCQECNGNFKPGISDNDYQLFLPVHLERDYQFTSTDRAEFLDSDPYDGSTLDGDWYFKPPVGLDTSGGVAADLQSVVTWEYTLPPGFATPGGDTLVLMPKIDFTDNLADGFPVPLAPAEVIALAFTRIVENDPVLNQTTYFPVRREHFMFGAFDLELPPGFGSDPIGDAGTGRQLLLLKWALEGAFVTAQGGVNQNTPSLDAVYQNIRSFGVPIAEGLEWGLFQEFAALNAGAATDIRATYGDSQPLHSPAGNDLEKHQRKKLKTMGKAAIRAALARLAGDPTLSSFVFSIDRTDYLNRKLPSFEDFILTVITNNASAQSAFGIYGQDRPTEDGPDIFDFLVAKKGTDEKFFDELFRRPDGYKKFILGGIDFLRTFVQTPTLSHYDTYMDGLLQNNGESERSARARNLFLVLNGDGLRKGLAELRTDSPNEAIEIVVGINNYAHVNASGLRVQVNTGGPAPSPLASETGSQGGAGVTMLLAAAGSSVPPGTMQNPPGDLTVPDAEPVSGSALDDPGEITLVLDAPLAPGETEVTELTAMDPPPTIPEAEPIAEDGNVEVTREEIVTSNPQPVDLPPLMAIRIGDPDGRALMDWGANPGRHLASPATYLRENEPLFCVISAAPNRTPFVVLVSTVTTPSPVSFNVAESPDKPGTYVSPPIRIGPGQSLHVIEEEMITFQLQGPTSETQEFMIDLAELAGGGIDVFYQNIDRAAVVGGGRDSAGFALTGDGLFPDNTGSDLANPLATFLLSAGSAPANRGETDVLHIAAHGNSEGKLFDHFGTLIYSPRGPFTFEGHPERWGADVEWAVLAACNTLNDTGPDPGLTAWDNALLGNRHAHGILGAFKPIAAELRDHLEIFWLRVTADEQITRAYRKGMEQGKIGGTRSPQNWAYTCWKDNDEDKFTRLRPDQDGVQTRFSDFADLNNTQTCAVGGRGDQGPVTSNDGGNGETMPAAVAPTLRLRRADPLLALSSGRYRKGSHGEMTAREWGVDYDRAACTSLTPEEARRKTEQFLSRELPALAPRLQSAAVGTRVSRNMHPNGNVERWTNGYLLTFNITAHGVRVWSDHLQVSMVGDEVRRIACDVHEIDTNAPSVPAAAVLSKAVASEEAIKHLPLAYERATLHDVTLTYAPASLLGLTDLDSSRFVLSWRLEFRLPEDGINERSPPCVIWINATSGEVVSVHPSTLAPNRP